MNDNPFPNSKKVYIPGSIYPDLRVPVREIALEANPTVTVYDTSGPYTDPNVEIDFNKGLKPMRLAWVKNRGDVEQGKYLKAKPGRNDPCWCGSGKKWKRCHYPNLG